MMPNELFHFEGLSLSTTCSLWGLDLNPFDEGGLFGSGDNEKAKKLQKDATKMWTGGANADEIFDPNWTGNRGIFGEIPDTPQLTYGDSAGDINPYTNGPGYIAAKLDPYEAGTSAFETRGPSAWGQVGPSAYGDLSLDPTARAGMEGEIGYFQDLQWDPIDAIAEADYQRRRKQAELSRRANTEAALGNLEARGMAGSGDALLAQLVGAEGAASDRYQAGLDTNATAQARRDAAAASAGQAAATLGQTQAQIDEAKAAGVDTQAGNRANAFDAYSNSTATGKDAFDQWNESNALDVGKYNADALTNQLKDDATRAQSVSDANTAQHNKTVMANAAAPQQTFQNKLAALGGATGQMNTQSGQLAQNAVYPFQDIELPAVSGFAKAIAGAV